MIKTVFQDSSPFFKIIFSGFIMVVSFIIVFILGLLIILPFLDISLSQIPDIYNDLTNSYNVNLLKYIQGLNTFGLFVLPPFFIAYLMGKKAGEYLNFNKIRNSFTYILVIIAMLISLPVINFLAEINSHFKLPEFLSNIENAMRNAEEQAQYVTEIFVNVNSFQAYLVNIIVIALLPALGEELIFRGVFQKIFISWTKNNHFGILIAAILFSAFHFQIFGFLPRMLMGVFFGYLLIWSKSIWVPIIAHFVNNAAAVTFYYLYNIGKINVDIENIGAEKDMILSVFTSALVLAGLIFVIRRNEKVDSVYEE